MGSQVQTLVAGNVPDKAVDNRPLLLVVDDDMGSLIMAEEALDEAGFRVQQAENGIEALEFCKKEVPDLIVMDVVMPKMNGFDACSHVRSSEWGEHIPLLMVTGLEDLESINQAYEVGATDFLTKPINFFVLPHRVRYMLRGKETADRLRSSQALLDTAQRIAKLGHWEWSRNTEQTRWSNSCGELIPIEGFVASGTMLSLRDFIHKDDLNSVIESFDMSIADSQTYQVEFRLIIPGVCERIIRMQGEPQTDEMGECVSMVGTIQDITERHNTQQQIHNLAYYDHVTGLPNRALLQERLTSVLRRSERTREMFAVLFLDLDRFKVVNDSLGHDAGDDLLSQVSQRLSESLRDSDFVSRSPNDADALDKHTIARLGGDEFVVLLTDIGKVEDAANVAQRIAKRIADSYDIKGSVVNISTTIGISVYPADGSDAEMLLKNADIAMYHAKKKGRNRFQFYSEEINVKAQERFSLEQDLRKAIKDEDFRLVYQPKIDCRTGRISGVEALIRWDHSDMGPVSPAEFIMLAEETELIIPLGEWIISTACEQAKKWHDKGFKDLQMSINCSSIQLVKADIPELMLNVLEKTGLDPKFVEIELTESLLLEDVEQGIRIIEDLRATGIKTSIDDFGTGYSSMSYLRRLPVDKLKIDQSFVKEIGEQKSDGAIVNAILTLAKHLGLQVVAEGVETVEQLNFLYDNGADEVQGYYISQPKRPEDMEQWMIEQAQKPALFSHSA